MYKNKRIDISGWVSSKNEEFKCTISALSDYVKKGVVSQAAFYIDTEGISKDSIQDLFGIKALHELNVAEAKYIQISNTKQSDLFSGTYPGLYHKIESSKNLLLFRKNYVIDKISYDFDMNQGMIYSFLSNVYIKSKIEHSEYEESNRFSELLLLINEVGNGGILEYKKFLLTVDNKVFDCKKRGLSGLLSVLEDASYELKEKLDTSLEIFDVPQTN